MKHLFSLIVIVLSILLNSSGNKMDENQSNNQEAYDWEDTIPNNTSVLAEQDIHLGVELKDVKAEVQCREAPNHDATTHFVEGFEYCRTENSTEESFVYDQDGNVTFVGTLSMLVHDASGEGAFVNKYVETDWEYTTLSFIFFMDRTVDFTSYLGSDNECVNDPCTDNFMLVSDFDYNGRDFANRYANKRVCVKGSMYAPCAGWRNATEIVMSLVDIEVIE